MPRKRASLVCERLSNPHLSRHSPLFLSNLQFPSCNHCISISSCNPNNWNHQSLKIWWNQRFRTVSLDSTSEYLGASGVARLRRPRRNPSGCVKPGSETPKVRGVADAVLPREAVGGFFFFCRAFFMDDLSSKWGAWKMQLLQMEVHLRGTPSDHQKLKPKLKIFVLTLWWGEGWVKRRYPWWTLT